MSERLQAVSQSLLLVATASLAIAGDPSWQRKSSTTGDIPVPNPGNQQTCCVVSDLDDDGDLDILMKPYNHRAPRLDILLNTPEQP